MFSLLFLLGLAQASTPLDFGDQIDDLPFWEDYQSIPGDLLPKDWPEGVPALPQTFRLGYVMSGHKKCREIAQMLRPENKNAEGGPVIVMSHFLTDASWEQVSPGACQVIVRLHYPADFVGSVRWRGKTQYKSLEECHKYSTPYGFGRENDPSYTVLIYKGKEKTGYLKEDFDPVLRREKMRYISNPFSSISWRCELIKDRNGQSAFHFKAYLGAP